MISIERLIVLDFHSILFNKSSYYFAYTDNVIHCFVVETYKSRAIELDFLLKKCIAMMIVEISYRCKLACHYIETSRPSFTNYGCIFAQHYSRDLLYTLNADILIKFFLFTSEVFKDESPLTFCMSFLKK